METKENLGPEVDLKDSDKIDICYQNKTVYLFYFDNENLLPNEDNIIWKWEQKDRFIPIEEAVDYAMKKYPLESFGVNILNRILARLDDQVDLIDQFVPSADYEFEVIDLLKFFAKEIDFRIKFLKKKSANVKETF